MNGHTLTTSWSRHRLEHAAAASRLCRHHLHPRGTSACSRPRSPDGAHVDRTQNVHDIVHEAIENARYVTCPELTLHEGRRLSAERQIRV